MISIVVGIALSIVNQSQAQPEVKVEKQVIYQKETTIDLSGSEVKGESQMPPAFFVQKMNTPKGDSLLSQRLKFKIKNVNQLGF